MRTPVAIIAFCLLVQTYFFAWDVAKWGWFCRDMNEALWSKVRYYDEQPTFFTCMMGRHGGRAN